MKTKHKKIIVALLLLAVMIVWGWFWYSQQNNGSGVIVYKDKDLTATIEDEKTVADQLQDRIDTEDLNDEEEASLRHLKLSYSDEINIEEAQRVIELAPDADPDYYLTLAAYYRDSGDEAKFEEYWAKAKKLAESNPEYSDRLEYIQFIEADGGTSSDEEQG